MQTGPDDAVMHPDALTMHPDAAMLRCKLTIVPDVVNEPNVVSIHIVYACQSGGESMNLSIYGTSRQ